MRLLLQDPNLKTPGELEADIAAAIKASLISAPQMKTVEEFEADIALAIAYSLNLGTDPVQIKTQEELRRSG
ncbi:MAG: hypothetical protein MRQ09_00440 [Candidatus Midichloria sp.]|nr:hypothetical protein [Candidatus Midichloria sp.]